MKTVTKKVLSFALILALVLGLSSTLMAQMPFVEDDELVGVYQVTTDFAEVLSIGCAVTELQEIASILLAERQMEEARVRSVDFRSYENLHLHPNYGDFIVDARFVLLLEISDLLLEASSIRRNGVRAIHQDGRRFFVEPYSVISSMGQPHSTRNTFTIAFTSEKYFGLIDFISEFTGIEKEMLEVEIGGIVIARLPE